MSASVACEIDMRLHVCMGTGHCFWEMTTNGCRNKDDTFKHNAYDFYAICRSGYHKAAQYQCKEKPGNLDAGKCKDRNKGRIRNKNESNSGKGNEDESEYHSYYYMEATTEKKYCYDCASRRRTYNAYSIGCRASVLCGKDSLRPMRSQRDTSCAKKTQSAVRATRT